MGALDPMSQARLFYLAILLTALLAGAFAMYRDRLGSAARHGAIWALIFLGAVIAYGFRGQLAAQLFQGRPEIVAADAIALRRAGDGHFYARATVNGAEIRFVVDTGATGIVLTRGDAERAGFDPDALAYTIPARTANGIVYGAGVVLDRFAVGPFEDRSVPATVNGGALFSSLLGMDWLDRFARWRVEGDRMILER